MKLALSKLTKGPATAEAMKVTVATLCALERRHLIRVETSLNAVAFPRRAEAHITEAGRIALEAWR